jgi:hypothetical protein
MECQTTEEGGSRSEQYEQFHPLDTKRVGAGQDKASRSVKRGCLPDKRRGGAGTLATSDWPSREQYAPPRSMAIELKQNGLHETVVRGSLRSSDAGALAIRIAALSGEIGALARAGVIGHSHFPSAH